MRNRNPPRRTPRRGVRLSVQFPTFILGMLIGRHPQIPIHMKPAFTRTHSFKFNDCDIIVRVPCDYFFRTRFSRWKRYPYPCFFLRIANSPAEPIAVTPRRTLFQGQFLFFTLRRARLAASRSIISFMRAPTLALHFALFSGFRILSQRPNLRK